MGGRVSASNWVEVSSKQTTGLWGSWGSAYRSKTSSMWAAKSALTLGMYHSCFCRGLRVFFQPVAHSLVGHGGRQPQFHHLARQQAQGPVVMPRRRWAAGQHHQSLPRTGYGVGFPPIVQLPVPVGLGPVPQHLFQTILGKTPFDPVHRVLGHIQGLGHPGSGPARIGLSRIRARVVTRAGPLPARTKCSNFSCCSPVSRTPYLSLTIPPPHINPVCRLD